METQTREQIKQIPGLEEYIDRMTGESRTFMGRLTKTLCSSMKLDVEKNTAAMLLRSLVVSLSGGDVDPDVYNSIAVYRSNKAGESKSHETSPVQIYSADSGSYFNPDQNYRSIESLKVEGDELIVGVSNREKHITEKFKLSF